VKKALWIILPVAILCFWLGAEGKIPASAATPAPSLSPSSSPAAATPAPATTAPPLRTLPPLEEGAAADYSTLTLHDSGDRVAMLQMRLRDLGYFTYKITQYYGDYTMDAVKDFQRDNKLGADGIAGPVTQSLLFSNDAPRKKVIAIATPTPVPTRRPPSGGGGGGGGSGEAGGNVVTVSSVPTGKLTEWSKVNNLWPRGTRYKVIDVNTGVQMTFQRVGGSLHADVEPATAADTAAFKRVYGGSWSWARRAVVVNINGSWIAASINGYPHGYETVAGNNMNGQVCIHFLNSRTHCSNLIDPDHQAMVYKAARQSPP
jgi:peptidoglycan hydrolase-like protein with peptidoglycan-binding domain